MPLSQKLPFLRLSSLILGSSGLLSGNYALDGAFSTSENEWESLNRTLGGRLHSALPLSAPCFPLVNGVSVSVNDAACASVEANYTSPEFRSAQFEDFMAPNWETCISTSEQCSLDSSNPANPAATSEFSCSQGSVSAYYIEVRNYMDVQVAFAFSLRTGVPLSIKNSGHDFKGRSSIKGSLSLWTRNLDHISFSQTFLPKGGDKIFPAITVGAGVPWIDVYKFADKNNVTAVGGYSETVGASGGWVMGGGHSVLSPVYGLGVDRVLQFRIVTADGEYHVANAYTNSDLFWALRGGGGGTFGVVLESTFIVEPQMKLQVASLSFNLTSANGPEWLRLLVKNTLQWGKEGWGGHMRASNLINVNPLLTLDEAKVSMKDASDFVLSQNGTVVIEELSSWFAFFQKYVLVHESPVGNEKILGSRLIPASVFETEQGQNAIHDALLEILPFQDPSMLMTTPFLFKYTQGSTSVTSAWRNSLWHLSVGQGWAFNSTLGDKIETFKRTTRLTQLLRNVAPDSGAYNNEADVYEPNHEQAFWGDNYPWLLSLKQKYDPNGLLECWHCVGWKGLDDPRSQCYPKF